MTLDATGFPSLQEALDQAQETGERLYLPAGDHPITESLVVDRPLYMFGDGHRSRIVSDQGPFIPLLCQNRDERIRYLVLRDFTVDGGGTGQINGGLIQVNHTDHALLEGLQVCNATNTEEGGGGVNGVGGAHNESITIRRCTLHDLSKAAINHAGYSASALIEGNTVYECRGNGKVPGIQINGGKNARVIANHVRDCEGSGIFVAVDGNNEESERCIVVGNHVHGNGRDGVEVANATDCRYGQIQIVGNSCHDNGRYGIRLENQNHVSAVGNHCHRNGYGGIGVLGVVGGLVADNTLHSNNLSARSHGAAVFVRRSVHLAIRNNLVSGDSHSHGIWFEGKKNAKLQVSGNVVEDTQGYDIGGVLPRHVSLLHEGFRVTTTSAPTAYTLMFAFVLPKATAYSVSTRIVGLEADGSNRAAYEHAVVVHRDGRNVGFAAPPQTRTEVQSDPDWGSLPSVSEKTFYHRVAGSDGVSVDWRGEVRILGM